MPPCDLQFAPLSSYWNSQLKALEFGCPGDILFCSKSGRPAIQRFQLLELIINNKQNMICTDVIDSYLELLCDHVNKAVTSDEAITINFNKEIGEKVKRRIFYAMDVSFYDLIHKPSEDNLATASRRLTEHGLQGIDFFAAKYLLLPLDVPIGGDAGHASLVVISGIHKTVSIYDSWGPQNRRRALRIVKRTFRFLAHHLGSSFVADEWQMSYGISPLQENQIDCGVFLCVNAMCVLFGWPHEYNQDKISFKRERMVIELLNGGFEGFGYGTPGAAIDDERPSGFWKSVRWLLPGKARPWILLFLGQ